MSAEGDPVGLIAGRCTACGQVVFPARSSCPKCGYGPEVVPHDLARQGVIYAATQVFVPSALGHFAPYWYGYVDIPEDGTRVFAPLFGEKGATWRKGRGVSLVFREIDATEMRGVIGYGYVAQEGGR